MEHPTPRTTAAMPWLLLLFLAAAATGGVLQAVAQADIGFTSIDCGLQGETSYVDTLTGLNYTTDDGFIESGVKGKLSLGFNDPLAAKYWNTVRSFPNGTRNCYTIAPLESKLKYLIRGMFAYSNYDTLNKTPIFDLYIGVNFWKTVIIPQTNYIEDAVYAEAILFVPDNFVQVCLVNTGFGTPFINGLEVRPLRNVLYPQANETHGLDMVQRYNLGPSDGSFYPSYPEDPYDRLWFTSGGSNKSETEKNVTNYNYDNYAMPDAVMRTAMTSPNIETNIQFGWELPSLTSLSYISIMHFSEVDDLPGNASRQYNISVNGKLLRQDYMPYPFYTDSVYSEPTEYSQYNFSLDATANSTLPPIINAIELFSVISTTNVSTDTQDASAITAIKKNYQVHKNWMGDPCFPYIWAWEGLKCTYAVPEPPIITSVNLSFSGLSGVTSPSFANIKNIQYLDLSNNNLTGSIPDELSQLPSLLILDLSNNQLSGSIPSGFQKRIQDGSIDLRYGSNPNLCTSSSCQPAKRRSKRAIIIVVLVVVIMIILLSVGVLLFCLQRRRKQGMKNVMASSTSNNDGYRDSSLRLENRRFTYKELEMITKNFREVLGQGGFGCVYHGFLENGIQVAVKLRSHSSDQGVKEFLVEAQVLTRIHHKNLVTMIGYWKEGEHMALVYEYMPEGNLQDHIAGRNGQCLTWRQRLRIAFESSQGLEYLHKGCNPLLIHRDVKATNVLLNTTLEAKIADFGMSKAFSVNSNAHASTVTLVGTPGYVDPEYQATLQPSTKSDVYSFGVVLLQLITGKPAILHDPEPIRVIRWAQQRLSRGDIDAVVDTRMQGDYDVNSVWKAADIALKCTEQELMQRPNMTEVVVQLQECLELEEGRIGVDTSNELNGGSNTTFEMEQNLMRAPTMDNGPAAR